MHPFDAELSLKDNYLKGEEIDFAAWIFADHAHREKYRDSGNSEALTASLAIQRVRALKNALAEGELLALGIAKDDPSLEIRLIPENLFLSTEMQIDCQSSKIVGLGREFHEVRVCGVAAGINALLANSKSVGRPNQLAMIVSAWTALKTDNPEFLNLDMSVQNRDIQEIAAKQNPAKSPGNSRIGESTIRRHRRNHPERFI